MQFLQEGFTELLQDRQEISVKKREAGRKGQTIFCGRVETDGFKGSGGRVETGKANTHGS